MFDDLRDLYQEVILDHGRHPRNFRRPDNCSHQARGNNPICGDVLMVFLSVDENGVIRDAAFKGEGCAISMASASMMTEILKGKTTDESRKLFECFRNMCTRDDFDPEGIDGIDEDTLDRLRVLSGVKDFPVRVKCATLAWHTMDAAAAGEAEASTE